MANAFILFGVTGFVKQSTNVTASTFNNKSGLVASLTINGVKYTHTFSRTNGNVTVTAGYYQEVPFLNWLVTKDPASNLSAYALNMGLLADAVAGDTVIVSKLSVVSPYTDFCTVNHYSWPYDPTAAVLDVNGNIIIPSSVVPSPVNIPLAQTAQDFYTTNISLITSSDFPDNRDTAAYSLALCALYIHRINADVFPLFSSSSDLAGYIDTQNTYWSQGQIFNQPTYEDILQYEENLSNYYQAAYSNQVYITQQSGDNKLVWLASVLDTGGLAVFPLDTKIKLLSQILYIMSQAHPIVAALDAAISILTAQTNSINQIASLGPRLIINVTASVVNAPTQTDAFLFQLLQIQYTNPDQTLFEALYDALSDNSIGTLTLGLIGKNADRKQFIQSCYDIWQSSTYHPYFNSPGYNLPANPATLVFPESFFITNKAIYYHQSTAPATLVYSSVSADLSSYVTSFSYDFKATTIVVSEILTLQINDEHPSTETQTSLYGTYNLYQPLSLIGSTQSNLVHVPQSNCIPAFYLKYAYDAKQIQDFDTGVLSFVELALNLVLNFTGVGEAVEIGYLAEISDIAEVSTLPESTAILTWGNFLGLNNTVMVTAGAFNAFTQYALAQSGNQDPQVQAFLLALNRFLGAVTLGTMAISGIAQIVTAATAGDVQSAAAGLTGTNAPPSEAMGEVAELADVEALATDMLNKLSVLSTDATNIISKFNAFSDVDKRYFYDDFFNLPNSDSNWTKLNEIYNTSSGRTLVDDWQDIEFLQSHRNNVDFLIAYRYAGDNESLLAHIFEGEVNLKGSGIGVHSVEAINNGFAQIDSIINPANAGGYYKAKISVFQNGVPKIKNNFSTFFPDSWNQQRIIEEIALVFNNKILDAGVKWVGTLSDGNSCVLIILSGSTTVMDESTRIITAYPLIIF